MDPRKLLEAFSSPEEFNSAVGMAREHGYVDPRLAGIPPEQLAELDRYSQFAGTGKELGYLGLPSAALTAVGNEFVAKQPMVGKFLAAALGDDSFRVNETTSKPSLGNVRSALQGFLAGAGRR